LKESSPHVNLGLMEIVCYLCFPVFSSAFSRTAVLTASQLDCLCSFIAERVKKSVWLSILGNTPRIACNFRPA